MKDNDIQNRKSGGVGKYFAVGCLTTVVILVIIGVLAVKYIKNLLVDKFTDAQPRAIPQLAVSADEAKSVMARVDVFKKAVKQGAPSGALVFTGDDINRLIQSDPKFQDVAGKVFVTIKDDKIRGEVSMPLDNINKGLKGRYLNGSGVFSMQLTAGRLFLFVEEMEVKGNALPEAIMKELKTENFAKDVNTDKEMSEVLAKLESIKVDGGKLIITPKAAR